ncbi:hypothetical protein FDA94_10565 [Herbidospora galbida]|uniref:Uncharacterized protein n=1 Tax=Herbidospora galbida TaxID=2575442 RepID=A0A4U3MKU0_9ACTN|nr:hypothetical protein [Herbidospora galbida]TKK89359.1 hypothetical protein FDA94_10565 [Herbidospora galbida]
MRRVLVALLLVAGCASPAWNDADYGKKAGATAEAAASSVALVRLAVESEAKLTRPYLQTLLTETATALDSVDSQFGAVQPPSRRAAEVRAEITELTSEAAEQVQVLLNEVRLREIRDPERAAADLGDLADRLRAFAEEHPS